MINLRPWLLSLLLASPLSLAMELVEDRLTLNTFGTLGFTRSSLNSPQYRSSRLNEYGVGDHWSSVLDNRIGAQLTLNLTDGVTLIGQGLVRRNSMDETEWKTTWAYARWRPDPQWEMGLGRFRHPLFMITEEYDVGYGWPWVRPPVEVYSLAGDGTYIDGGKLRYQWPLDTYQLSLTGFAGQLTVDSKPRSYYETRLYGVELALTDGDLTLRTSLLQADVELEARGLQNVIDLIASQNPAVADDYAIDNIRHQRYANLGLRYDNGQWLVMAEYVRLWLQTRALPDKEGYYLTLGRNLGEFTPYLSYARQEVSDSLSEYRLTGIAAQTANAFLRANNSEQRTYSLGVRWDFYPGLALKAQVDQVHQAGNSVGQQGAYLPGDRNHFTVTSVVLDWAF